MVKTKNTVSKSIPNESLCEAKGKQVLVCKVLL